MNSKLLHTPVGVRDIYNDECYDKLLIQNRIHKIFKEYGYSDIQTPTFEFFDIFNKERGSVASKNMYKFFDREGNTLVLRPDMTPSIARASAKYFMDEEMPIRLCYVGNAFINNSEYQGKLKEFTQIGSELLGDNTSDADAEVIAMVIESLLKAGLTEFQIEIGQPEFFKGIVEKAGLDTDTIEELRELLENKKYFGVEDVLEKANVPQEDREVFLKFQEFVGSIEMIKLAKTLNINDKSKAALERLEKLYSILVIYGYEKYISFDLSMLNMYQYYTGIVFKGYTYGTGDAIVTGGRYDNLLGQFGKDFAAIGFAVNLDQLMVALERQHIKLGERDNKKMILYGVENQREAINYTKTLRSENECVMMVRKRSNHQMEDYISYAKRSNVSEIIIIDGNGIEKKEIN
ncbi:MAG: ATP phosphoribosyltransferase regulatory subunit [Clostridiales bacterium]|jgi:ATP phosphoribosyltransferase regulatory subunit|uniref:ATP phosphoribosyltransferase regulatory subunit n=1 Tax=Bovifimicola ammoniilytica TaxID=2981720 RepID=UPI00033FA0BD|nr:ATP phosphoribosyltransferase regulatory subunit [Bovifimicola ammoniilytica]MBD8940956.1 ATP phosphoribosyltransferase regulatory subunit [Clostridiales bacterium]MCU6753297.1 ATP phosphoribosyltransferase regulatory subunit [Bovifimicola ammoniilytica]CCZ04422.1 aTP phosphoribosyltransferase regulatory subunit [Eubacterium sp. CAG:603]SCJ59304.1 ATP phosphoribosyltransferase regulatory subunit [uncultured Eubacterium sp.]